MHTLSNSSSFTAAKTPPECFGVCNSVNHQRFFYAAPRVCMCIKLLLLYNFIKNKDAFPITQPQRSSFLGCVYYIALKRVCVCVCVSPYIKKSPLPLAQCFQLNHVSQLLCMHANRCIEPMSRCVVYATVE